MNKTIVTILLSLSLTGPLAAAPATYDFKDPKGVNAIQFHLDSLLEPISGTASGVSGTIAFDPADPTAATGRIVVAAKSLLVTNTMMTEHLHSPMWLDVANHPEISFELDKLSDVRTYGNVTTATATGRFTLKGVTKEIAVPVKLTHLADAFGKRLNKPELKGDLLVVRGEFTIKRADYGIQPGKNEDKVNPDVQLTIAIVGGAPQS